MDPGFILFVLGVVVVISAIGLVPLFLFVSRADGMGAKIGLVESFQLLSRQSTDKEFLKAIALDQNNDLNIGITRLETHLLAGGDPLVVSEAFLLAKEIGMDFDFSQLATIQLGGKDPLDAVNRTREVSILDITKYRMGRFEVDYHAQYRFGIRWMFGEQHPDNIEQQIKEKLTSFGKDWPARESSTTRNFLLRNILNSEYWEKIIGVQLIQHYLEVRPH